MFNLPRLAAATIVAASLSFAAVAAADDLPRPDGEVLLTISGEITNTNGDGIAAFDLDMLRAMPQTEFTTSTIWTEGPATFTGVLLSEIITAVGAEGANLRATAINDYAVEIPTESVTEKGPVVAYLFNGEEMSVREKGPLWIVYPYDAEEEFRNEVIYSRSIWQLDRITVAE